MNTKNFKVNTVTILDVSKRTVQKILTRAKKSCSICNWDLSTCDIHHIINKSHGGTDDMDNLILVCPNCHRCIHNLGESFKTVKELQALSFSITFPEWKQFYNWELKPINKKKNKCKKNKTCVICGCDISQLRNKKVCSEECYKKHRQQFDWSSIDIKELLISNHYNLSKISRLIGVSDNSIRKYCVRNNIDFRFG